MFISAIRARSAAVDFTVDSEGIMLEHLKDTISHPAVGVPLGIAGFAQTFFDWATPLIQFAIGIATLTLLILGIMIRYKQYKKIK